MIPGKYFDNSFLVKKLKLKPQMFANGHKLIINLQNLFKNKLCFYKEF